MAIGTCALLVIAVVFGGASRVHELRLALVELAALPVLIMALSALLRGKQVSTPLALALVTSLLAIPIIQLIPLPAALWTSLPGRRDAQMALDLIGATPDWAPLTLTPDKTWRSLLALLPPVAMFLAVVSSKFVFREWISRATVILTLASVLLGAAQLAGGGDALYPWATTEAGNVVGFFANRNHLATLCLLTIPFATVAGAAALRRGRDSGRLSVWIATIYIALVIVALGVIRSRMGVVLVGPTLLASVVAAWIATGGGRPKLILLGLVGGSIAALSAVAIFALPPLLARFDTGAAREGRFENWPTVLDAAQSYLPVGSGLGSFDSVYRSVEPLERLDATFFNQAHNDYLETWLEAGWFGAAVVIAFLVWFARRCWVAWRAPPTRESDLHRAASIAIGVVLLHSAVDYPLRTETIAVVFALCCALLDLAGRASPGTDIDQDLSPKRRRRSR